MQGVGIIIIGTNLLWACGDRLRSSIEDLGHQYSSRVTGDRDLRRRRRGCHHWIGKERVYSRL